ncbi:hypothetical protein GALMADRAFT_147236 [Galerina marginata CBS 339.88]|uniref:Uncharacterized protein n=1 Tax=Galerina marginata (strain CBS 339.88) TaxID=685588 RepID=A0A067S8R9_GALM3|nr:hypothetical protein GALMADRAFT_147236 [Galerina marginata CBS 339.88]
MSTNTRSLKCSTNGLIKPVSLMLTFSPFGAPVIPYLDVFPTGWRRTTEAHVRYTANTAFTAPQIDNGDLVAATSSALCGPGRCTNATTTARNIAIGFSDPGGGDVEPVLFWEQVASVLPSFSPAITTHPEKEILRGAIETSYLWKNDLKTLNKETNLSVSVNRNTGDVLIKDA